VLWVVVAIEEGGDLCLESAAWSRKEAKGPVVGIVYFLSLPLQVFIKTPN
jgi:hypothetical protein